MAEKATPTEHPYQSLAVDRRVKEVLRNTPLFDGHNDLPQQPRAIFHGKIHDNILDRGATQEQLSKCIGDNMIRVWEQVVKVRDDMKKEGVRPVEDVWEGRQWWRYDGFYQMNDPDPDDKLGYDWYGVPKPEDA